jgi:hypothetical protein
MLLDILTVFFLLAGCFLLLLNLKPRHNDVIITPLDELGLPPDPQDDDPKAAP